MRRAAVTADLLDRHLSAAAASLLPSVLSLHFLLCLQTWLFLPRKKHRIVGGGQASPAPWEFNHRGQNSQLVEAWVAVRPGDREVLVGAQDQLVLTVGTATGT